MQPPQVSRIGVVTDALVTLFGGIHAVDVFDGPDPKTAVESSYILVGAAPSSADVERERGLGNAVYLESLTIPCYLQAWSGDPGMKAVRDTAVSLLGQVRALLPTLKVEGLCDLPQFGNRMTFPQSANTDGTWAGVTFSVLVKTSL